MKLFTELSTLDLSRMTVAIAAREGFDFSAATELFSAFTDEVMALVWLGKSLLAELTVAVAAVWTVWTCDFQASAPLLAFRLFSPLTAFWRLVRSVQYAGLLLLQPARATIPIAMAQARRTRIQAPR